MSGGILLPGNATTAQVLSGKTFSSGAAGMNAVGTLVTGGNVISANVNGQYNGINQFPTTNNSLNMSTGTPTNMESRTLGAGIWVVSFLITWLTTSGTSNSITGYVSTVSASTTNIATVFQNQYQYGGGGAGNGCGSIGVCQFKLSTTTTIYVNVEGSAPSGGFTVYGAILWSQVG